MTLAQVGIALVLTALNAAAQDQTNEVKVEGFVHDSANKPLQGVKVTLYATGKKDPIDSVRTDEMGQYKLTRRIDSTYDILYTHSQMDLATVELLAESKNQQVSIKMYKRGEARTASAYHETLHGVERVLFLALLLHKDDRGNLLREYDSSGASQTVRQSDLRITGDISPDVSEFFKKKRLVIETLQVTIGVK